MNRRKKGSRFLRIDERVYTSAAFRTLPPAAMKLWIMLRMDFTPLHNGRLLATMSTLRDKDWRSADMLRRNLDLLIGRGLVAYTRKAGPNKYRHASWFRFTDEPVAPRPAEGMGAMYATDDYLKWRPDAKSKRITPRKKNTKSVRGTNTGPGDGLTLVRQTDYSTPKSVRETECGESTVTPQSKSVFDRPSATPVRSPSSGHTLESASLVGSNERAPAEKPRNEFEAARRRYEHKAARAATRRARAAGK